MSLASRFLGLSTDMGHSVSFPSSIRYGSLLLSLDVLCYVLWLSFLVANLLYNMDCCSHSKSLVGSSFDMLICVMLRVFLFLFGQASNSTWLEKGSMCLIIGFSLICISSCPLVFVVPIPKGMFGMKGDGRREEENRGKEEMSTLHQFDTWFYCRLYFFK